MADVSPEAVGQLAEQDGLDHKSPPTVYAGVKRKGSSELDSTANGGEPPEAGDGGDGSETVSKRQLKRLKRQQAWDGEKQLRKDRRKEKRHNRQARKRAEKEAKTADAEAAGLDVEEALRSGLPVREKAYTVPVSFIIDCDFEGYMRDNEIVSLSTQLTRSYAENRRAQYRAHLFISPWKGKLRERFVTTMNSTHEKWKGVTFVDGNFVEAADKAKEQMLTIEDPGTCAALSKDEEAGDTLEVQGGVGDPAPIPAESIPLRNDIVYLTSDSPYTLENLEANTSYVIGGIVDRNREKGLCYKRAVENNVRTAKLPIGQYMAMNSRYVLTTNQVLEIMSKWLACGDWGEAFMSVIPKRKGGALKDDTQPPDSDEDDAEDQDASGLGDEEAAHEAEATGGDSKENGKAQAS